MTDPTPWKSSARGTAKGNSEVTFQIEVVVIFENFEDLRSTKKMKTLYATQVLKKLSLDIASDTACSMAFWIGLSVIKPWTLLPHKTKVMAMAKKQVDLATILAARVVEYLCKSEI